MKVLNFWGVPNQFVITNEEGQKIFQSHSSIIAIIDKNWKVTIWRDWDFSKTTWKYRNLFLWESKKETERKIKNGEYILDNTLINLW
jgi:hypothetical protein